MQGRELRRKADQAVREENRRVILQSLTRPDQQMADLVVRIPESDRDVRNLEGRCQSVY